VKGKTRSPGRCNGMTVVSRGRKGTLPFELKSFLCPVHSRRGGEGAEKSPTFAEMASAWGGHKGGVITIQS